jgi:hypothetical protein
VTLQSHSMKLQAVSECLKSETQQTPFQTADEQNETTVPIT